jgi:hypothetical protein
VNDWSAEHEAEYTNILTDVPVQFRFLVSSSLLKPNTRGVNAYELLSICC